MEDTLGIEAGGAAHPTNPGVEFSFGRAPTCTVCLDPADVTISRLAGRVEHDGRGWWVVNTSSSRQLALVDEFGLRSVLPPGRRAAVEGPMRIIVDGSTRTHEIALTPAVRPLSAEVAGRPEVRPTGQPTAIGESVLVNDADRAALVALFAGYLEEGGRYDPYPKSYAAAAARLGWPRTTLVKRIEYLRQRLTNAGVPNLNGWNAMASLAEFVLTTGLITRADLQRIDTAPR